MRTTLTLDDDLAMKLRKDADRQQVSFKEALNAAIRRGLGGAAQARTKRPYRTQTFRGRLRAGVDPLKLNQLSDDLETRPARAR
jgi:hypothetical protein